MGEITMWEKTKEFIGGIAWEIFIWSISMSEDEYFECINQQKCAEKALKQK